MTIIIFSITISLVVGISTLSRVRSNDAIKFNNMTISVKGTAVHQDKNIAISENQITYIDIMQYDKINTVDNIIAVEVPYIPETEYQVEDQLENQIGDDLIIIDDIRFIRHDLPDEYYPGIDYSSFQPYLPYDLITNKQAPAYDVVHSQNAYTDEYGLRRYYRDEETEFKINGQNDYIIALGTFYKDKGVVGNRYLIVTTNGMYTATTGDEKCDSHTDPMHMFSSHADNKAGVIEWIVDKNSLNDNIRRSGTVTNGGPDVVQGEILYIYEIE
jgi:hypothetical protein